MNGDSVVSEGDRVALERRIAELEQRLAGARSQLAEARDRLDGLVAEQASALLALQTAERRRGSLGYRLVAEVRSRLRRSR
jgi:predicted  nucleic acid-binding Zn-ribbon protein